ncbi:oligosaccharyl transferase [Aureococcus anophagefferens]|nr:oligosaccharyl transferase [Aureococcus anophagefferens]
MASAAGYVGGLLRLVLTGFACHNAYDIRMSAIRTYGLLASVAIWRVLNELIGYEMSLNDVCVYVPVWFGVAATLPRR